MLLITVFQSVLSNDYSGIYTNANGGSASDLKYNLTMQKNGSTGHKSMLILHLMTGGMLNGLMSAQLNVEKVPGQSGHGIHPQNSYKNVISMKFDVARVLRRCFGLDLAMIHRQDWCH